MIYLGRILIIACFSLTLIACSEGAPSRQTQNWRSENGKLKVLTTIAMIDDLVKKVGGDYVDSITLIKGELDPHSYQLVKGDDEKFAAADVIFYNGLGLEHGPSLHHYLQLSPKAIGLGNRLFNEDPALILYYHGRQDPHIWMDISLWAKTVPFIVDALSKKDPQHAENYQANGAKTIAEMMKAHENIKNQIQAIPESKRYLVTSHDAFSYFTRAYLAAPSEKETNDWQKRFAAPEGLAPESQLSTKDIQDIIDHLQKYHIHVLFLESNGSKDSIRKILQAGKEKGMDLIIADVYLYADAMGKPGSDGDTYLKMIEHDANALDKYLDHNNKSKP